MPGPKPTGSKKIRPSFDVARDPIADTRSGWVYRSDGPAAADADQNTRRTTADEVRGETATAGRSPAAREERFEPDAAPAPERGWLATGVYIMVLPVTLGMSIMFAPIAWLLGGRSRR